MNVAEEGEHAAEEEGLAAGREGMQSQKEISFG